MATAQITIFWLLRIYHLATAHHPNTYLLQIDQFFYHWKSSKYLITVHRKIVWQPQITYLETFRPFIWLLLKAQFLGYCASIILLVHISQLFMYCKSTIYFTTGNRLHNCLLCIEKFYDNFKSPIWKHHHHHVLEGLGMLACSLILQMKLVPPSLPRSSYVSSSVWFVF